MRDRMEKTERRRSEQRKCNENERHSHIEVLDRLLPIHHFARKWELKLAVRIVDIHWCVHVGVHMIVEGAAAADESNQGQRGERKDEGSSKRNEGGTLI
jgi:hypothetical protein